jgi:hypothetical protein
VALISLDERQLDQPVGQLTHVIHPSALQDRLLSHIKEERQRERAASTAPET